MYIYDGGFIKKDGSYRHMVFIKLDDLPEGLLPANTSSASRKEYDDGQELVYDLEANSFRVFNWDTIIDDVEKKEITEERFMHYYG